MPDQIDTPDPGPGQTEYYPTRYARFGPNRAQPRYPTPTKQTSTPICQTQKNEARLTLFIISSENDLLNRTGAYFMNTLALSADAIVLC